MKKLLKLGTWSPLFCATSLYALNPIQGFYIGLLGEMSHGPSGKSIYFQEDATTFQGNVAYSPIGGGAGFMLGYKYSHLRAEAQFLYNRISTGPVTVGTCTLESPNVTTPTGVCTPGVYDSFQAKALGYSGSSSSSYGYFNAFWDFFSTSAEASDDTVVPYIGVGAGFGYVQNGNNFINTTNDNRHGFMTSSTGMTYQGILGLSHYMDDFTWCSLDFRYTSISSKPNTRTDNAISNQINNKAYTLSTFNLTINAAFDAGGL